MAGALRSASCLGPELALRRNGSASIAQITINQEPTFVAGKRTLSLDHIRALHEGLGIPFEVLIEKPSIKSAQIEVSRPILKKLSSMGFELNPDGVASFLQRAFGVQHSPALLARTTRTQRASAKTDEVALLLWQAAALIKAAQTSVTAPFNRRRLTDGVLRQVAQLRAESAGPKAGQDFLSQYGIIVIVNPMLPGTFLDGAAMLLDEKTPVVVLTLRHDRVDNFWFTLLHELSQVSRHYETLQHDRFAFFDDLDLDSNDEREVEADELAQEALIPSDLIRSVNWTAYSSNEDVTRLARSRWHSQLDRSWQMAKTVRGLQKVFAPDRTKHIEIIVGAELIL